MAGTERSNDATSDDSVRTLVAARRLSTPRSSTRSVAGYGRHRATNSPESPRVRLVLGDLISDSVVQLVGEAVVHGPRLVMMVLDNDHSAAYVRRDSSCTAG